MIDVALTPGQLRRSSVAVVIDVLRATSTATQALAAGYRRVLCADSTGRADGLRARRRVLAGERHCVQPHGFDQGNSPLEASHRRGDELVLATTNGTPAVVAAATASPIVLLACVLNLESVIAALRDLRAADLQIVCSGTDGAPALEDVYLGGRLAACLPGPRTDPARVAEAVAQAYGKPLEALNSGAHAAALRAAGMIEDVVHCAQESTLDVVPEVIGVSHGVAVLGRADRAVDDGRARAVIDSRDTVTA